MSLFNKLFGNSGQSQPEHTHFKVGDVFYYGEKGSYAVYKLVVIDEATDTFHVLSYGLLKQVPKPDQLDKLNQEFGHAPIDKSVFKHPVFIANTEVTDDDMSGYFEYLKQTNQVEKIVKYAKQFYQEGFALTDQKNYWGAINKYSHATLLLPQFYEAFDNWAFCQMDLGNFDAAIPCFQSSLKVNPNTLLPTFSIGECYFKLADYTNAKSWFEKAVAIDPEHPKPKEFLNETRRLLSE